MKRVAGSCGSRKRSTFTVEMNCWMMSVVIAPGMSSQRGRVFLAMGITEGPHDREHEEQDMRSRWFTRAEVEQMIRDGVITDAQSIAAWTLMTLAEVE